VFDEPYDRIAEIVGTTEQNARRLATRARRHVQERRPRFEARFRGSDLSLGLSLVREGIGARQAREVGPARLRR
jgi:hypothetical protein